MSARSAVFLSHIGSFNLYWFFERTDQIYPFKDEAQTALFKDPVRTAQ
jgi:hypothetical protein